MGGFDRNLRAVALSRLVGQRLRMLSSTPRQQDLQALRELLAAGKVTPVIDRTYPLGEVPEAIRYLAHGHGGGGKVVITV
jgi:NADPH:quinone reductase-like Zn-dependent oxidoreductase